VVVGPTPDQATFTPDGKRLVAAISSAEDEGWTHLFQLSVPEHGTSAVPIAGYGFVGGSLRRRCAMAAWSQ
jgi:hypothetical protein